MRAGAAAAQSAAAAACRPLSQQVTAAAALITGAPSASKIQGTVNISNKGAGYLPIELVTVRLLSKAAEDLRAIAQCPQAEVTLGPFAALTCTWEAALPKGASADMYSGLIR
jgi:hypothetical protein